MIPAYVITNWSETHNWSTREQIEQDFLLSQAICEISNNEILGKELIIRGGTAFHKLFLPKAYRYSEDLDYVRSSGGGIGQILDLLTQLGGKLGYKVNTKIGKYPKVYWKSLSESGSPLRIKIEINTYERSPAMPLKAVRHSFDVGPYSSFADANSFQAEELTATKIRALYQREKGRDLFDIWLSLDFLKLNPITIAEAFKVYRPGKFTSELAIDNLKVKLKSERFLNDLDNLSVSEEIDYQPVVAAGIVIEKLLCLL